MHEGSTALNHSNGLRSSRFVVSTNGKIRCLTSIVLEQQLAADTGQSKLAFRQQLCGIMATTRCYHEADYDRTQCQPHPKQLTAALIPGFFGVNTGGKLHVRFDGPVRRCQHGADRFFRLTDDASAETLAKVLQDLADALVKLATLQGNAAMTGAEKQLMLCHPKAYLGQIKDLMTRLGVPCSTRGGPFLRWWSNKGEQSLLKKRFPRQLL